MDVAFSYSRLIAWAKIGLPVLALGLLSTLFLMAETVDPSDALSYAEIDVSELARARQVTAPRFAGVSQDGTSFDLSAGAARPDAADPRILTAESLRLALGAADGPDMTVSARFGQVDTAKRVVTLAGDIRIETSNGYALRAERIDGALGRLDISASGGIVGSGPLGSVKAGGLRVTGDAGRFPRLVFNGGIEMLYHPPSR